MDHQRRTEVQSGTAKDLGVLTEIAPPFSSNTKRVYWQVAVIQQEAEWFKHTAGGTLQCHSHSLSDFGVLVQGGKTSNWESLMKCLVITSGSEASIRNRQIHAWSPSPNANPFLLRGTTESKPLAVQTTGFRVSIGFVDGIEQKGKRKRKSFRRGQWIQRTRRKLCRSMPPFCAIKKWIIRLWTVCELSKNKMPFTAVQLYINQCQTWNHADSNSKLSLSAALVWHLKLLGFTLWSFTVKQLQEIHCVVTEIGAYRYCLLQLYAPPMGRADKLHNKTWCLSVTSTNNT